MKNKFKRKISTFLLAASAVLSGCASSQNDPESKHIVIEEANFVSSYSSISFNFAKDERAESYSVFFSINGINKDSLINVEPQTNYSLSFLPDGVYKVSLKAKASYGFIDSDSFPMGELRKEKPKKSESNIELLVTTTENYEIKVNVKNKIENDQTPITSIVYYKLIEIEKREHIVSSSLFVTKPELPAGEYKVVAFFEETETEAASDELFFDKPIIIPKREIEISSFEAVVENEKVILNWIQSMDSATKILKITNSNGTTEFFNNVAGTAINPGMIIDESVLAEGNNVFELKIKPYQGDMTYLESNVVSDTLNVQIEYAETPLVDVFYNDKTGALTIDCLNAVQNAKYLVKIKKASSVSLVPVIYQDVTELLDREEEIASFPYVIENANLYRQCEYSVSVKKIGTSIFYPESPVTTKKVEITKIKVVADATITESTEENSEGNTGKFLNVECFLPEIAEFYQNVQFSYEVVLRSVSSQKIFNKKTVTFDENSSNSKSCTFSCSFLPNNSYEVFVGFSPQTKSDFGIAYGFDFTTIKSSSYNFGSGTFDSSNLDTLFPSNINFERKTSATIAAQIDFKFSYVDVSKEKTKIRILYKNKPGQELTIFSIKESIQTFGAERKTYIISFPTSATIQGALPTGIKLTLTASFDEKEYSKDYTCSYPYSIISTGSIT